MQQNSSRRNRRRALWIAAFGAIAVAALLSIWVPWWLHFDVRVSPLDDATITALRTVPSDERLEEIGSLTRGIRNHIPDAQVARQVARMQGGHFDFGTGQSIDLTLPFKATDYDSGTSSSALNMATLIVPDTLLHAAAVQADGSLFATAKDAILQVSAFEKSLIGDYGLIRNDHAIAARVGLLTEFWRQYRQRPDFNAEEAQVVIEQLRRCAKFLAKPSHYTAWTNHGVMQNVALLQFAAAFPGVPEAALARQTGYERLRRQMTYFIHPEGAVLEHGPGYHRSGLVVIDMARQLVAMNDLPEIPDLRDRYSRGVKLLEQLTRPDGSLPRIGDTNGAIAASAPEPSARDTADTAIYPGAGYAIFRRALSAPSQQSHATVFWSRFVGHGHEVEADTSWTLWAAGRSWIGNTGYWPYSDPARDQATGWRGSNAAHLRTELVGRASTRAGNSTLVGQTADLEASLIDTARPLEGGGELRRQVLQVGADNWVVLDFASPTSSAAIDRLWTFEPDLELQRLSETEYLAKDPHRGWRLLIQFTGPGASPPLVEETRGNRASFGGWVMNGPIPLAASALVATQRPGAAWLATRFRLLPPEAKPIDHAALLVESPQRWSLRLPGPESAPLEIVRRDAELIVTSTTFSRHLSIEGGPSDAVLRAQASIAEALAAEKRAFPRFRTLEEYRRKLSLALVLPVLLTAGAGFVVAGWSRNAWRWAAVLVVLAWALLAAWVHFVYFAV